MTYIQFDCRSSRLVGFSFPKVSRSAALLFGVISTVFSASAFGAGPSAETDCREISFSVALAAGAPANQRVVGTLCDQRGAPSQTLQLLLHGATYNRSYWDFSVESERYSYVRYAHAAGFATLALDRLGAGRSDHPAGYQVTTTASSFTVHQIISALRAGSAVDSRGRAARFDRIVLVGHSFGSFIAWTEAGTYHDVDGVIISGSSHLVDPPGSATTAATLYPAQFDPLFASAGYPTDYFTTLPGTRAQNFYYVPGADSAVIAADEASKDVVPIGLFADFTSTYGLTQNIHVPVLGVVGDFDSLSCAAPSCTASQSYAHEGSHYPADACFTSWIVPQTGHDLNLHRTAPLWFAAAQTWALARVGVRDDRPAPLPCP